MGNLVFQAASGGQVALSGPNTASSFTIAVPAVTGTLVTTGDTGTVTTTMLASTTGSGAVVLATSPTLVTPALGTPTSVTLTNATGLPLTTGVTGTLPVANGGTNLTSFTSGGVVYASSTSALATGSGLVFDGTNLGLGVTPSAWSSSYKAIQFGSSASLWGASNAAYLALNAYQDAGGTNRYLNTNFAVLYGSDGNGGFQWRTAPSGTAGNAISFTQAMTLDASGNLVVGGTSAVYTNSNRGNISINGASTALLALSTGGTGRAYLYTDGSRLDLLNTQNDAMTFGTNNTERARIDSSGNLIVGGTLANNNDSSSFGFNVANGNQYNNHISGTAAGTGYIQFSLAGTVIGSITQSGTTAVLYNVTSDQRLKENIVDADSASSIIDSLQVRKFDWKADGNHQRYGFVAQELVTVAPEAVHQPIDPKDMMAVDYSKLVPMLVKEIQSLRKRILTLENK